MLERIKQKMFHRFNLPPKQNVQQCSIVCENEGRALESTFVFARVIGFDATCFITKTLLMGTGKRSFSPPSDADEFMMIHPNEWLPYVGKLSNIPLVWLVYAICLHSFIYFYRGLNEKCAKNWPIIGNANARKICLEHHRALLKHVKHTHVATRN